MAKKQKIDTSDLGLAISALHREIEAVRNGRPVDAIENLCDALEAVHSSLEEIQNLFDRCATAK